MTTTKSRPLRVGEAASKIGVSPQTISRACDRGTLAFSVYAGLRLIDPLELRRYNRSKRRGRPKAVSS